MTDYGLKVGMTMSDARKRLNSSKVNEKIKQLFNKFCDNDYDGKITDKVELAVLNTYLSGQSKIKMSNVPTDGFAGEYLDPLLSLLGINTKTATGFKGFNGKTRSVASFNSENHIGGCFNSKSGEGTITWLRDEDGDGYADRYSSDYTVIDENGYKVTRTTCYLNLK